MIRRIYLTIIIAFCSVILNAQGMPKEQLRDRFLQATMRRSALDSFMATIEKSPAMTAYEECYLDICNALQIQYLDGMWAKYKMLDRSRDHINRAVAKCPHDAEIRFIRFMLEHNIPGFLGMSTHIRDDLRMIFSQGDFLNDNPELKKMAMDFILASKRCTAEQQSTLQSMMMDLKKREVAQR